MQGGHLAALTSLRFFAAGAVGLYHAAMWTGGYESPLAGLSRFGFVGVTFFYVLSGFVLTWTWKTSERVRFFYLRRFARVWPLHALTALLALVLGLAGLASVEAPPVGSALNLALLQAWIPDRATIFSLNGAAWSLSNEAFFYAVFPLLILLGAARSNGHRVLMAAGAAWLIVLGLGWWLISPETTWFLYSFPLLRVGEFVVGMGLGLAVKRGLRSLVPMWVAVVFAGLTYLSMWVLNPLSGGFIGSNQWATSALHVPAFALLILTGVSGDLVGRGGWLRSGVLVKLGQWSFAYYLVHGLMLQVARDSIHALPHALHYWAGLVVVIVAVPVAGGFYEWFERPVERRIRAWGHQRGSVVSTGLGQTGGVSRAEGGSSQ